MGVIDTAFMIGVIAPYAQSLGASEAEAGLIAGLYSLVALFVSLFAGFLVDVLGRKRCLVIGLASDTVVVYLYSLVWSPFQLAVLRVLHALGGSLIYPAFFSMVGDLNPARLGRAAGDYLAVVATTIALGAFASSILVSNLGFDAVFTTLALILAAGLLSSLKLGETVGGGSPRRRILDFKRGARSSIAGGLLILVLYVVFGAVIGGFGPALLKSGVALSEEEAAAITGMGIGIATITSVPVLLTAGRLLDRGAAPVVCVLGTLALSSSQALLLVSLTRQFLVYSFLLLGVSIGLLMSLSTYLVLNVPPGGRGLSVGVQQTFNILGVAIGAPLAGLVLELYGVHSMLMVFSAASLAGLSSLVVRGRE